MRFRQLRRAFGPGPRRQGYGHRIDLKFTTNNGTDHTSEHAKFEVIGYSTFRDMTSQKFPFQKGTSHCDSIFTPCNRAKLNKSIFMLQNSTKLYPFLHFHSFQAKQKNSYVQFFETCRFRNNCSPPPPW